MTSSTKARAAGRPPGPRGQARWLRRALAPAALAAACAACGTTYTRQELGAYDILVPGVACVPWHEAMPYLKEEGYHRDEGLASARFVDWRVIDGPFPEPLEPTEEGLPPAAWSKTRCNYVIEQEWKSGILGTR